MISKMKRPPLPSQETGEVVYSRLTGQHALENVLDFPLNRDGLISLIHSSQFDTFQVLGTQT